MQLRDARYRTIVADPPWPITKGGGRRAVRPNQQKSLDYPTMSVDAITRLDVASLAQDGAGLEHVGMHELRHTAGTHFHMEGHDLVATQHFMRHANPATTAKTYVHLDRVRAVADVQRRMADPLGEDAE